MTRNEQINQILTIARSLSPIALTRLLRFCESLQQQSQGKTEQRAKRRAKPIIDDWRIGK